MSPQSKSLIPFIGLNYVTTGVCIIDKEFTIVFWNRRLEEWTRKSSDTAIGQKIWTPFPKLKNDKYRKRIEGVFLGGPPVIFSSQLHPDLFQSRTLTGKRAIQEATVSGFPLENGELHAIFSIEDITALSEKISQYRTMRDIARSALEEKEVLLREMHHRIKNNLYMVTSLIDLKMTGESRNEDLTAIKSQLQAIRLVHEKLYQGDSLTSIRFDTFAKELIESVFSFSSTKHPLLTIEAEDYSLQSNKAIPIGLILNEIASNALKHGFKNNIQGHLQVSLDRDTRKGRFTLSVSNNGEPFPEEITLHNAETLGLRLISSLVEQIEGTIELQRTPSPTFIIRFPR